MLEGAMDLRVNGNMVAVNSLNFGILNIIFSCLLLNLDIQKWDMFQKVVL